MKGKAHASIGVLTYYNFSILSNSHISIIGVFLSLFFSLLPDLDHFNSKLSNAISSKKLEIIIKTVTLVIPLALLLYLGILKKFDYSILFFCLIGLIIFLRKNISVSIIRKIIISLTLISMGLILNYIYHNMNLFKLFIFFAILPWFSHRSFSHSIFSILILFFLSKNFDFIQKDFNIIVTLAYASHILLGDIFTPSGLPLFWPLSKKRFKITLLQSKNSVLILEKIIILLLIILAIYLTLYTLKYKTPQQILLGSSIFNLVNFL